MFCIFGLNGIRLVVGDACLFSINRPMSRCLNLEGVGVLIFVCFVHDDLCLSLQQSRG